MKISCKLICRFKEAIANLKCPKCFGTRVSLCEEEKDENAECKLCGCQFEFKPEFPDGGMD